MKYENFEQAQGLVETINKYKKIMEEIKKVFSDIDRSCITTKLQITNYCKNMSVSSSIDIDVMTATFAYELLESYKEHIKSLFEDSMKELEKL